MAATGGDGAGSDWLSPNPQFEGAFADPMARHSFIRKVYGILSIQLALTFGSILAFALW